MQSKRITKAGGLTLPKQIRAEIGVFAGSVVDVEIVDDSIVIKKHTATCKLCGELEDVISFKGMEVCKKCVEGMQEGLNGWVSTISW